MMLGAMLRMLDGRLIIRVRSRGVTSLSLDREGCGDGLKNCNLGQDTEDCERQTDSRYKPENRKLFVEIKHGMSMCSRFS